ncbi:Membrane carboxypeptidase (penicillin-binding protein) [Agromyces sp. CF514]|uniref:transglycosylase domain-containing protein n=1 Tax=Agromyces sp. CF514 TaxID=1881031 RepID=UPI0008F35AC1|nr:transglycosylase domain-containing protein [Agromyces sp. CF514]SFR75182.1 Membrane carboxypeptidase (penicillin-binding protein) [Agromyces sp. CF514]
MTERNKRNRDFAETRTPLGVLGGLVGIVVASTAAAALIVVGVTPALATVGMAASGTIDTFERLPGYLQIGELSQKSNIYATRPDGSPLLLASFYDQNRVEVEWDQISPFVKDATIAGEDPRFYDHGGVDLQGTIRAALTTAAGRDTQGGSSIAQQYVKNVRVQQCEREADVTAFEDMAEDEVAALTGDERFALIEEERLSCYDSATETSIDRKLKEMRLAIGVEKRYSKNDILLGYLNIAGFGGTVYGIEAAANYYFSTSAANLTLPQAASLVAIVNNPVKFQLDKPDSETNGAANGYAANRDRRDYLLRQMLHEKKITQAQYDEAIATPVEPKITEPSTGCQTAGGSAYFCDYVKHILQNDPTFGDDDETRMLNFRRGGYQVYTSLDLDLQAAAERAIAENVPSTYPGWDLGGVISSVEVGTGRVLAMAQNKQYSQDPAVVNGNPNFTGINYNTDYDYGGSSGFQPGSSYKVFTLAEWLAEGHALTERVNSSRKSNWGAFNDSCLGTQYADPGWNPRNDANEPGGNYSALESTIGSINTGFLGMAKLIDQCGIASKAEAFGVHRADGNPLVHFPSAVLGINEVAPLSMAVAFAGIANDGVACTPVAIDRIVGADGEDITPPKSTCAAAVTPEVAGAMHYAMSRVMSSGTGQQSSNATSPWVPLIGKTGTTDGAKDTWMVGASTEVATAVAVVSVNGDANQRGISFDSGSAATARHRMWPIVMSAASAKYGGGAFRMDGPGPVAPFTSPTPFDDVPKYVEPTPTPPPAPAPAPAPSPQTQTQGGVGDRTLEPRDDEGRGGGRGR